MNPSYRQLIYTDLLYRCLTLSEVDATALLRLSTPKPFTFPDDYKIKELAGQRIDPVNTSIEIGGKRYSTRQYNELYFQGVRSIPTLTQRLVACEYLSERYDLEGVPGFYFSGCWKLNLKSGAIVKPYHVDGKTAGLFIYQSHKDPMPKLLTSEGFYKGTSAIQPTEYQERMAA